MASFAKHLSVFLFIVLFTSLQIQARESRFFSKFTHSNANNNNVEEPQVPIFEARTPAPTPASAPEEAVLTPAPALAPEEAVLTPAPAPTPTFSESENGYGLYGGGSSEFTPTKETPATPTKFEDEFLTGELSGKRFETGYPKTNLYNSNENSNNYNNNGYNSNSNNNNNNNGYTPNYNSNGYSNNYNNNGYYSNNYNNNGYQTERQGMSDTRFLENGKYYFHVSNENNNLNGYETRKETTKNEGYYGNNMYPNEFNSMEEYEKQEENQEEFEP